MSGAIRTRRGLLLAFLPLLAVSLLTFPLRYILSQEGSETNRISAEPTDLAAAGLVLFSAAFAQPGIEVQQPDGTEAAAQFFRYVWDFGDGTPPA